MLTGAHGQVSVPLEVLREAGPIGAAVVGAKVLQEIPHAGGVRPSARHEACAERTPTPSRRVSDRALLLVTGWWFRESGRGV